MRNQSVMNSLILAIVALIVGSAFAQGMDAAKDSYSPYTGKEYPRNVYFADLVYAGEIAINQKRKDP